LTLPANGFESACILDEPGATAVIMTEDCSGESEILLPCPGEFENYECVSAGNNFEISGLNYSSLYLAGEAEDAALGFCEELRGVICDENQVCSTGVFTEANDTDRCCLGDCISAADLSVIDVSMADPLLFKDEAASITVTVKNIGWAAAEAFTVSLSVKDGASIGEQDVNGLAVEEETTLTFSFNPANYDGLLLLEAKADSQDEIMEADEENNVAELEVFVRERLPEEIEGEDFVDLVVLNTKLSGIVATVGEEVTVTASVLNSGTVPSAAFTVGLYANSIFNDVFDEQRIDSLAPLESAEVTLTLQTLEIADGSEIIVFADAGREIVEADEENNTDSAVILLTGEELAIDFTQTLPVNETQVFTVTDVAGKALAGAKVKINYPFEDRIRTESVTTDVSGVAQFTVDGAGTYSFTVSKPGYFPYFGEFEVIEETVMPPTPGFEFDMNLLYIIGIIIVLAGAAYYILVLRKK
jgi:subtilase family serine protease